MLFALPSEHNLGRYKSFFGEKDFTDMVLHFFCRCATDGMRPAVDLEDSGLIRRMLQLFHGSPAAAAEAERRVQPASAGLRARLVSLFCRSISAANAFPENLQVHSIPSLSSIVTLFKRIPLYQPSMNSLG